MMKAAQPEVLAAPRSNPGETLRKARESRNWSIGDVAAQLNLTVQRVGQIEAGAFDKLPGQTFARGYVRTYAKLLGLDQNRLVLEFDYFTNSDASACAVHNLGHIEEPVRYSQSSLRIVSFVLLLALAGAGFYWWQEQSEERASLALERSLAQVEVERADGTVLIDPLDEPEDQAVLLAQGQTEMELPLLAQPAAEAEAAVDTQAAESLSSSSAAVSTPEPAGEPVAEPVVPAVTVDSAPLAAGQGRVSINFVADCWTQLTDADGRVLFSALKRKGESLELVGKAPLELRLGFARGAEVSYNGSRIDVAPFVSGETARIKLGGQ
jgi:cytoskeleton protein RodZ